MHGRLARHSLNGPESRALLYLMMSLDFAEFIAARTALNALGSETSCSALTTTCTCSALIGHRCVKRRIANIIGRSVINHAAQ